MNIAMVQVLTTSFPTLLLILDLILGFMTNGSGGTLGPLNLGAIYA